MLLKRVNNLCVQDKKRKENVPSGVPYLSDCATMFSCVHFGLPVVHFKVPVLF